MKLITHAMKTAGLAEEDLLELGKNWMWRFLWRDHGLWSSRRKSHLASLSCRGGDLKLGLMRYVASSFANFMYQFWIVNLLS